jgi:hypothetical protein
MRVRKYFCLPLGLLVQVGLGLRLGLRFELCLDL